MRRFYTLFAITALLFSFSSCGNELDNKVTDDDVLNSEDIIIPAGNYITFHADVNTRGALQTGQYITESFGVYGYQYDFSSSWTGQRAVAIPNVFWNVLGGNKVPLEVTCNDGIYSYTANGAKEGTMGTNGQVSWNTSNRYAFWAYYPYENNNPTYFNVSSMDTEGSPYITYTVDRSTTANMYDVMTGGISQITAANSGNTVTFGMNHRLSAVDVSISNAYNHEYAIDGTNYTEEVDIVIDNLKLEFSNLKYSTAKIFLEQNKNIPALNSELTVADNKTATYQLIGGTGADITGNVTVEPTKTAKTNLTADNDATMIFIPQEIENLSVTVTADYSMEGRTTGNTISKLRVNEDGEPLDASGNVTNNKSEFVYDDEFTIHKTIDFNQSLVEGTRYYIVLNFTSEAVSINIITAEAWDDKEIDYEFM